MKKMNKKGFTLIELLAVIVILGLLMAIAIPSVTKYITQSRKKTLTNTISNYMSALTTEVNNMEYIFTESNTIYAVPIECIAVERGGSDPFGQWYPVSDSNWAYVLVQYDDKTSSYTYGFTFKDTAGYALYPTASTKLQESGKQVSTNLDVTKPATGKVSGLTDIANWTGFKISTDDTGTTNVNEETSLQVLTAGNSTDKKTTCVIAQK